MQGFVKVMPSINFDQTRRDRVDDMFERLDYALGLVVLRRKVYEWSPRRHLRRWTERARKGWSLEDTFSFDSYLAGVIVGGVQSLRDNLHGYPPEMEGPQVPTEAWVEPRVDDDYDPMIAWDQTLWLIQRGFQHIVDDDWLMANDKDERDRIEREQDQSKRLFVYWFGALWD